MIVKHSVLFITLENMVRDWIIDLKGNLDKYLPLLELSYNNSFHSSISMAFYEALYGRRLGPLFDGLKWVSLCFLVPI